MVLILAALLATDKAIFAQPHAALPFVELSASQPPPRALASHVVRQRSVEVHRDALENRGWVNQQLSVNFFPDVSYTAVLSSATRSATGVTWTGRLEDWPSSMAVFATAGEAVVGFVASPFGTFSLARDGTGGYAVQQSRQSRPTRTNLDPAVSDVISRASQKFPPLPLSSYDPATRSVVDSSPASQSVVDVLVAFTAGTLAAQEGGIDELKAKALVMIGIADAALREAGAGGVRLAGFLPEPVVPLELRGCIEGGVVGGFEQFLAPLDERAADVMTIISEEVGTNPGGVACQGVGPDCWISELHPIYMLGATFAHELGHNLGLGHDWYMDDDTQPPWAKGYVSPEGRFRTIMAYSDYCYGVDVYPCLWMPFFSDPNGVYNGFRTGVPIGTSTKCTAWNPANPPCDADAASALRESVSIVAGYGRHSNHLSSGSSLSPGQFLRANGRGAACLVKYQGDGNLVASFADGTAYWSTRTAGTAGGSAGSAGSVVMQDDGNLVVFDSLGAAVWASGTQGNAGASFAIQRDCNLVIRATSGEALWSSGAPASRQPPAPMASIQLFAAEPRVVEPGGHSRITLLGYGTEVSIWLTHPNGERVLWDPPGALDRYSREFVHQPEWGTGDFMLEAVVTGAEGMPPAKATTFITVTSSPGNPSPGTEPWILRFTADPTTIKSGGWSVIRLEAGGTESSIWIKPPNGERHLWDGPGPLRPGGSKGLYHRPEWGTGILTLEAVVTGAEGTHPARATVALTVTP